jgi:hypothetical protein
VTRIDFEKDTLFASEFPPPPGECGMMIALSDSDVLEEDRPSYGWKDRIGDRRVVISECECEFVIDKARIVNARFKDNEMTIIGENDIRLHIGAKEEESLGPAVLEIPVFDGAEIVAQVRANCPGNRDFWLMAAVHILLPNPDGNVSPYAEAAGAKPS